MKKQLLILATVFVTVEFISCSKEKVESNLPDNNGEITTKKGGGGFTPVSNKGLLGRFEFNNNLKDMTGQLPEGVSTVNRVLYTEDRKGAANSAIRFNEAYGVDINDVPTSPEASLSVWVKHDLPVTPYWHLVVASMDGFIIQQHQSIFNSSYYYPGISGQSVYAFPIDNKWHHFATTFNNNELQFYVDGILIGTSPTPSGIGPFPLLSYYKLAYGNDVFWKGALDDLRFYARVLSAGEINTLANQ
ncbi:MAG TPA: LamG domain-containing protein [Chitinophagaceae bacterium]